MGGDGSGRHADPVKALMQQFNRTVSPSVSPNLIIPNLSGDHSAGNLQKAPVRNIDLVNKKYVDDSIAAIPAPDLNSYLLKTKAGFNQYQYIHNFDDFLLYASGAYTPNLSWVKTDIASGTLRSGLGTAGGMINEGGGSAFVGSYRMGNRLGVVVLSSKTGTGAANTGTQIRTGSDCTVKFGEARVGVLETDAYFPTWTLTGTTYLSYEGEDSIIKIGFVSSSNTTGIATIYTNDCFFMIEDGVLTINCRESGGATRTTDITATANLSPDTWYRFKVVMDWENNIDYFYIYAEDGSLIYSGSLVHGYTAGTATWGLPTVSAIYVPSVLPASYGVPMVMLDFVDFYIDEKVDRSII